MISGKLQFHGVTIKDSALIGHGKGAAEADGITHSHEVEIGIMSFYLTLFLLIESWVYPMP